MADTDRNNRGEEEKRLLTGKEVSRRDFLKMAGVAGAAVGLAGGLGGLVAACGDDDGDTTTTAGGGTETSVTAGEEMGREIKLGFVSPLTGGIASFGVPDQYCVDRAKEAIGDGIVCGDGKKHPVSIVVKDSQSDTARAAAVTGDLVNNDQVDIVLTASTPDTVAPVASQCEALAKPCLSNDCPWQPYVLRAGSDFSATFQWTYHCFWGLEDMVANYLDMWAQVPTNKKIAVMFSNDADGLAYDGTWPGALEEAGYAATKPSLFQLGTENFQSQIGEFKKDGCELAIGVFIPPDFTSFWTQCKQQGFNPKLASFAKALLFPESVQSVGEIGNGLTTEVWWTPTHPFTSPLTGETCQQFADEFTKRNNGAQWTQPLLHFLVFEWAVDVLQRTTDVDDKNAIIEATKATKMETIGGHIDFTEPVPAGPPFQVGPCHIHPNVYKTPQVGGQWRTGTDYPYELVVVTDAAAKGVGIPVADKVQPLA
ncbi:MAG: ABC transporter substrate-binding protein [Actinobacteria bacterium]|nr:ABC transporter substrate-binding protein [Actinomycetota bacterium]